MVGANQNGQIGELREKRETNDEIQRFVDAFSWDKLKEVYEYLNERDEDEVSHRVAAKDLDLPPIVFEHMWGELHGFIYANSDEE